MCACQLWFRVAGRMASRRPSPSYVKRQECCLDVCEHLPTVVGGPARARAWRAAVLKNRRGTSHAIMTYLRAGACREVSGATVTTRPDGNLGAPRATLPPRRVSPRARCRSSAVAIAHRQATPFGVIVPHRPDEGRVGYVSLVNGPHAGDGCIHACQSPSGLF